MLPRIPVRFSPAPLALLLLPLLGACGPALRAERGRSGASAVVEGGAQLRAETAGRSGHIVTARAALGHPLDERTAHDRPVGAPVAHLASLLRPGDAETDGHRRGAEIPQPRHQGAHP